MVNIMETKDIYECYSQGVMFSDRELKLAIKHYKNLSNILMISGREFKFAADAAFRVYQNLYQYGISRELLLMKQRRKL